MEFRIKHQFKFMKVMLLLEIFILIYKIAQITALEHLIFIIAITILQRVLFWIIKHFLGEDYI